MTYHYTIIDTKKRLKLHSFYWNSLIFSVRYKVKQGQWYGYFHRTKIALSNAGPQYSTVLYTLVFHASFKTIWTLSEGTKATIVNSCKGSSLSTQQKSRILTIFISENTEDSLSETKSENYSPNTLRLNLASNWTS